MVPHWPETSGDHYWRPVQTYPLQDTLPALMTIEALQMAHPTGMRSCMI